MYIKIKYGKEKVDKSWGTRIRDNLHLRQSMKKIYNKRLYTITPYSKYLQRKNSTNM